MGDSLSIPLHFCSSNQFQLKFRFAEVGPILYYSFCVVQLVLCRPFQCLSTILWSLFGAAGVDMFFQELNEAQVCLVIVFSLFSLTPMQPCLPGPITNSVCFLLGTIDCIHLSHQRFLRPEVNFLACLNRSLVFFLFSEDVALRYWRASRSQH